jgi:acetone carboxylase gamma subunit
MHVFFDMVCGKLPWGDAARAKEKPKVIELKKRYYEKVDDLIAWQANLVLSVERSHNVSY